MANEQQVFNRIKNKLQSAVRSLPKVMGNEAVNFSIERFNQQNWLDNGAEPWKPRSTKRKKDTGKSILVQTGRLRRATRIFSIGDNKVVIGNDVPYARVHNYGGTITRHARSETFKRNRFTKGIKKGKFKKGTTAGKGFTYKGGTGIMPKRQFMGRSQALIVRLKTVGQAQIAKALNS